LAASTSSRYSWVSSLSSVARRGSITRPSFSCFLNKPRKTTIEK
jgi:hypothetical protein